MKHPKESHKSDRKFTEGITAMMVGFAMVILGETTLNPPAWTAGIFIPAGIFAYIIGFRCYMQSYRQSEKQTELLGEERGKKEVKEDEAD